MGNFLCMGLFLQLCTIPSPRGLDRADNGLAPRVDVNMLHRHFLLTFAAVTIEGIQQNRKCPRKLVCLVQVLALPFQRLLSDHGSAIAFHCCSVGGHELGCHHSFQLILRCNSHETSDGSIQLLVSGTFI